jgi:hypothetical protein
MKQVLRVVLYVARSVLVYLAVVVGGSTLFLIVAPVFGYLPYSDRPGAGWFGSFPAIGWGDFWSNTLSMLEFGLFFGILFLLAGLICVLSVRGLERFVRNPLLVRVIGGVLSALVSGYWMLGAGWYIAAGLPLIVVSMMLGGFAGAWVLPRTTHEARLA